MTELEAEILIEGSSIRDSEEERAWAQKALYVVLYV